MAHFAELNENNIVTRVIVVANTELLDNQGIEQESKGILFCQQLLGGNWRQTSYNGNFRKNYAGVGYTYDTTLDAFISPRPYSSWVLVTETCQWEPPIPMPQDGNIYQWDEDTEAWINVTP
jgi:hypothetical protein